MGTVVAPVSGWKSLSISQFNTGIQGRLGVSCLLYICRVDTGYLICKIVQKDHECKGAGMVRTGAELCRVLPGPVRYCGVAYIDQGSVEWRI